MTMKARRRPQMDIDSARWIATITYRTDKTARGVVDVVHQFEEITQLHDIVEYGPTFEAVVKIEVQYRGSDGETIDPCMSTWDKRSDIRAARKPMFLFIDEALKAACKLEKQGRKTTGSH